MTDITTEQQLTRLTADYDFFIQNEYTPQIAELKESSESIYVYALLGGGLSMIVSAYLIDVFFRLFGYSAGSFFWFSLISGVVVGFFVMGGIGSATEKPIQEKIDALNQKKAVFENKLNELRKTFFNDPSLPDISTTASPPVAPPTSSTPSAVKQTVNVNTGCSGCEDGCAKIILTIFIIFMFLYVLGKLNQ